MLNSRKFETGNFVGKHLPEYLPYSHHQGLLNFYFLKNAFLQDETIVEKESNLVYRKN